VRPPPKKASANPVINEAFAVDGSAIVDAVVVAGEMLNMPHVERQQVGHYAMAKIKEAVLAVAGG
jgi:pyruvate dehydrogenase (quinone)